MKTRFRSIVLFLCLSFLLLTPVTASAHPADLYTHTVHVTFSQEGVAIEWQIQPGPLLVPAAWFQADLDKDDAISPQEADAWAQAHTSQFTATVEHANLPLTIEGVQLPSNLAAFQTGAEKITVNFDAVLPQGLGDPYEIVLYNGFEEARSTTWYTLTAQDGLKFPTPVQNNQVITVKMVSPSAQGAIVSQLWTAWDSGLPSIPVKSSNDSAPPAGTPAPALSSQNSREYLLDLIQRDDLSLSFYGFALGISLVLGALHALTPGHGKTVVAAYLVGSRGTSWHAVVLGSVVTFTHTGSVLLLGVVTLAVSQYFLPTIFVPLLEVLSGLMIVGLGVYLLRQRIQGWRKNPTPPKQRLSLAPVSWKKLSGGITLQAPTPGLHHHGDGKLHSHDVPETISWRSLIALGVSGGLVPCPDAIAILLVAIAINRIVLGLALIVSFSLGLAVVLIVIGLLMVNSRRLFDRTGALDRFAPILPVVSAVVVLALGAALTTGAYARFREEVRLAGAGINLSNEPPILYLSGGREEVIQLYMVADRRPVLLSGELDDVVGFSLSPDRSRLIYNTRTDSLENSFWLVDLNTGDRKKLLDCTQALCSRPVFSPNGDEIVYEYLQYAGKNTNVVVSPWWMDLQSGENKPLFQALNFPGSNPQWSPDGDWLSYTTTGGLRLYHIQSGESRLVESAYSAGAAWSPDGGAILFRDVAQRSDGQFVTQVFVYRLDSDATVNLSPDLDHETLFAAWSPDGNWIAMVRRDLTVERGDHLWLMRSDGSDLRALTESPNRAHGSLAWSPDGRYLLYDVEFLDVSSTSHVQVIEVATGEVSDLELEGYAAQWLAP
jgi:ABC-type nickel/cobalt efflux system permease component RcnA/Tol biopolymer transport system component